MPTVKQNALKILGWLYRNNPSAEKPRTVRDLMEAVRLSESDFWDADSYLFQGKYVDGTMGTEDSHRWLTEKGTDLAEQEFHRPSFFQRRKDDLIMLAIGMVAGVIGTLLVQMLGKLL